MEELEQLDEPTTAETLLPESCTIYKLLKQVRSLVSRKIQQEDVEMSAFDEQQLKDKFEIFAAEGLLKQSVASDHDVQLNLERLCSRFK